MSKIRLELRVVVVPLNGEDTEHAMVSAQRAVAAVGAFFEKSIRPYEKPPGSFMVRVEADCAGDAVDLVDELLGAVGGNGWITSGSGDEVEAVWAPQDGSTPPLAPTTTWAHIQAIPIGALPAARRKPKV